MHGFGERACAQSTTQGNRDAPRHHVRAPEVSDDFVAANGEKLWDVSHFRGPAKVTAYTLRDGRVCRSPGTFKNGKAMILHAIRGVVKLLVLTACFILPLGAAENAECRNTAPTVAYVGSSACAGCHPKIYRDYTRTAMGRSMKLAMAPDQLASGTDTISVFSEKLNRHFEFSRHGSDLYQTEYELDKESEIFRASHKLDYVIGSGNNSYAYVVRRGNFLFEAPLSYYSQKKGWDLSPGYEVADRGFNRPIAAACIACHSGRPQPVREPVGLFRDLPFLELSIGCENCHGPGALHVEERRAGTRIAVPVDSSIVNPGRLTAGLAEDICMNCHQGGDTRILQRGKSYADFRPGTPLYQTLAIFRIPLSRGETTTSDLLEHHFSMHLSKCYRASSGRLSCLTCHAIHSSASGEGAMAYRTRCLTCHSDTSCRLPMRQRLREGDDCVKCHMPKRQVQVISHSALTNHRIIARTSEPLPEAAFAEPTPGTPGLTYWNAPNDPKLQALPPLMLLQAYGELMEKEPRYLARYLATLEQLAKDAPDEPLVQASLGSRMLRSESDSNDTTIAHLTRAIELGFTAPGVYADLAEALVRAKREEEAERTLERGIGLMPYEPVLYKSLVLRLINLKRYAEARKAMESYMELFPEDDFMRGMLTKVGNATSSGRR
jgi:hypothetical protein